MERKKYEVGILTSLLFVLISHASFASKFVEMKVVDKDYIMVHFKDGDVEFVDDGLGQDAFTSAHQTDNNIVVAYGDALNLTNATNIGSWVLKSDDDTEYGTIGLSPVECFRKSKVNGLAEMDWNTGTNDFDYEYTMEHYIYLKLPKSLSSGKTYTLEINSNTNSDVAEETLAYDIFNSRTEAIHLNLVGYSPSPSVKAADLYMWLGDGAARDYSAFEGNTIYIYNVNTEESFPVGSVSFWKSKASETPHNYYMIQSDVWNADFSSFNNPGTYRLAIEGVGCSEDFEIAGDIYYEPYRVNTLGFYYMRIGEEQTDITPVPRQPLYIPGVSPATTKVYVTEFSPIHPDWGNYSGDNWDNPTAFSKYIVADNAENPNAYGGHSDALDWDRHLGHVVCIYDMLLPYILTDGALNNDDLGITESGNGIPDIIDEAKNEVDFWLRLRYKGGYSHGLSNPKDNILYQGGNTPIAAWANAANSAMLAEAYRIQGNSVLMAEYRDSAINAFNYGNSLTDQMLDDLEGNIRGRDFKMTAAAFLYNVTGNTDYEDIIHDESLVTSTTSTFAHYKDFNQLYATAAYLKTNQTVNYQELYNNMIASAVYQAKQQEANYTLTRPSRRAADNNTLWFHTEQHVQRCILAHAVATNETDKALFEDALVLEASWSLGRNSANLIQMTTATTPLESKRSILQCYTSGRDDGSPGVHPGHTPYLNLKGWGSSMVMDKPDYLTDKGYPVISKWPTSESYFNVRYIYSHAEFTPQQTMRGKQALYGYLYGIGAATGPSVDVTGIAFNNKTITLEGSETIQLTATIEPEEATNRLLLWETSDQAIVKVDPLGNITGVAAGTADIIVTTADGSFKDTCKITVTNIDVTGISVSPSNITLAEGQTTTLSAEVLPANALHKSVSWSSDKTNIASVDEFGEVKAIAEGTATISVKSENGEFTANCTVTVEILAEELIIYRDQGAITTSPWEDNGTLTELTTGGPEGSKHYKYDYIISSWWDGIGFYFEPRDISQYENLVISVKGPSSEDNYLYVNLVDVDKNKSETYSLTKTDSYKTFTIPVDDLVGATDIDLTTINDLIIGLGGSESGTGTFYVDDVYFSGSKTNVPATNISVSPVSGTIDGGMLQLTATVLPSEATNKKVTWSSNNPQIATVNKQGYVIGISEGTAIIKVTSEDGGFTASAEVKVVTPTQGRIIKVMPLGNSITQGDGYAATSFIPGGYRLPLWQKLVDAGLNCGVDLVGTLTTNSTDGLGDPNHEGHSGWTTGMILEKIDEYMTAGTPDIVMMHLGTNDIAQEVQADAPDNLRALIDHICAALPEDGKLYVSKIIPIGGVGNESTLSYNDMITAAVTEKQGEGMPAHLVDAYNVMTNSDFTDDWTHPNQQGYNKLGNFWFNVIKDDVQLPCATNIPVDDVSVAPTSITLEVGNTKQLEAIVTPTNATNKTVTWSSDKTDIATISETGLITAKSAGTATITVTSNDGAFTAQTLVTINPESTTNIDDPRATNSLSIYPNPSQGNVFITIEAGNGISSVAISNSAGETVLTIDIDENTPFEFDTSELPQGIYFVSATSKNNVCNKKLIVE